MSPSLVLVLVCLAAGCGGGAEEGARGFPFRSATWTQIWKRTDASGRVLDQVETKVWMKGRKVRAENLRHVFGQDGGPHFDSYTVAITDGRYQYFVDPRAKRATRARLKDDEAVLFRRWNSPEAVRPVGREILGGVPTQVFAFETSVDVGGLATVRMHVTEWRWKGLPIKSVARPLESGSGDTYLSTIEGIILDQEIPDRVFELPEGTHIEEIALESPLRG